MLGIMLQIREYVEIMLIYGNKVKIIGIMLKLWEYFKIMGILLELWEYR